MKSITELACFTSVLNPRKLTSDATDLQLCSIVDAAC